MIIKHPDLIAYLFGEDCRHLPMEEAIEKSTKKFVMSNHQIGIDDKNAPKSTPRISAKEVLEVCGIDAFEEILDKGSALYDLHGKGKGTALYNERKKRNKEK